MQKGIISIMKFKTHAQAAAVFAILLVIFGYVGNQDYEDALDREARAEETRR